jgi:hypothetical protein
VTSDLARKLGLRPPMLVAILGAPTDAWLAIHTSAPAGVRLHRRLGPSRFDLIFFWPRRLEGLAGEFARLRSRIIEEGAVWAVMPKKAYAGARGIRFSWEAMQAEGLKGDLVDNKIASITPTDYGTRFVVRRDRRARA